MEWLIYLMLFVTIISLSGMALGYVEGRRKHRLEMQREERLLIEARTKELEAHHRRAELEYRSALTELERFDRRGDGATAAPPLAGHPAEPPAAS
jgi:hypothetical protein